MKGPARTEAIKALATVAGFSTAAILGFKASGMNVEVDPRSSDFGKLKVGNTRYDLTFGQGQYVRVMAQALLGETKSADGSIKKLNTGEWGSRSSKDVIADFFAGKESPLFSLLSDFMAREDRDYNKLGIDWKNLKGEKNINSIARVVDMFRPLVAADALDAFAEGAGNTKDGLKKAFTVFGLAEIGIGIQTYDSNSNVKNLGVDQRTIIEKVFKTPERPDPSFQPLLDKMVKEKAKVSVPSSKTTIKPDKGKDSREMTSMELESYQKIYQNNLKSSLKSNMNDILKLTGKQFEKKLDKIKSDTTKKSKDDLIKGMLK